ncbi:MAG TPA: hypothetical protein VF439_02300 [Candidatus Paceibacterota bacterium]
MPDRDSRISATYHFVVTLPDRLYPFRNEIEGQWVRGIRSYDRALERAFHAYGDGHYGYRLAFYRFLFHVVGALIVLSGATFVAHRLFGGTIALIVLLALAMAFITYQEFVLQRRMYRQLWRKGVIDWLTWCVPLAFYAFFH